MSFPVIKDPAEDLDYTLDWTSWLEADTIATSTWSVIPSGIELHDDTVLTGNKKTVVWIQGGSLQTGSYLVTNEIVTAGNRRGIRSLVMTIQHR